MLFIYFFREMGTKGEREGQKHWSVASWHVPTGDWTCNPNLALTGNQIFNHSLWGMMPNWYREIWSDHWDGVGRGLRNRMPKAMVNSLRPDWLRSWMPPDQVQLWVRRFEIRNLLSGGLLGSLGLPLPWGWLVIVLQLLAFPKGWYFGWEGTPGAA